MGAAYSRPLTKAITVVTILLALGLTTPADAGPSLARKAYNLAKVADARSKRALAAAPVPVKGDAGPSGARGADGANGRSGLDGQDGINGARGDAGVTGAQGERGASGAAGRDGAFDVTSVTTTDIVNIVGSGGTSTIVSLALRADEAGLTLVLAEGQVNGENDVSDFIMCALRVDGAVVADRVVTIFPRSQVGLTVSALVDLTTGQHSAALTCRKGSDLSALSFPAERTRLTALG